MISIDVNSGQDADKRCPPCLAVIVPCFNEEAVAERSVCALLRLLADLESTGEIAEGSHLLLVDDGSTDSTPHLLRHLARENRGRISLLMLSCNMGHQNALMAGIEAAYGNCDASVSIDADLQDDPEAIREMVSRYRDGYEIVYGVRRRRDSDSWLKRNSALAFYRMMRKLGVNSVYNHADFRLMSSKAMKELCRYRESNLFLRGLVPRLGFRQTSVSYDRRPRPAGHSKYPLGKMVNFMLDGVTSFSVRPVRMIFTLGLLFTLIAVGIAIYIGVRWSAGRVVAGWSSMMLSIWFCTGVLLMALGVIGEYLGKIYTEVKRRPRYSVDSYIPADREKADAETTIEAITPEQDEDDTHIEQQGMGWRGEYSGVAGCGPEGSGPGGGIADERESQR